MASISGLVQGLIEGDSFLTQIFAYNAAGIVLQALMTPYSQRLLNDANSADGNQFVPISPADLADMVVRAVLTQDQATPLAALSGISADNFDKLIKITGEPPALEQILQWARRGFIPFGDQGPGVPSVPEAVRTSRIYNQWLPVIEKSQFLPLTVADAVNAWVRNQIPEAAAKQYLYFNGIQDPEATTLYNTAGRPPAPGQLADLVNRGVIPVKGTGPTAISFEQGIIESDIKDKWEPILEEFIVKYPGVFEIRLMQQQGAINAQQAYALYKKEGLPDDVATAAVAAASVSKTAKAKELAQGTVEKLYLDQIITRDEALSDLEKLGFDQPEAVYTIEVWEYAQQAKTISAAVTAVKTRYLGKRIPEQVAKSLLSDLGMPDAQITNLLAVWDVELQAQVRILTEAQILDAVEYGIADQGWATGRLEALGYSADDAYTLISIKLKSPQPNPPEGAPTPPQQQATGTTGQ